jgi:hypothetical protein
MKTGNARLFNFDIECPKCGDLITNKDSGNFCFSIYESVPPFHRCDKCDTEFKTPKKVSGCEVIIQQVGSK